MPEERLQKILARAGLASRRAAEQLITSGRVTVNGELVSELGARANTDTDRIQVDGVDIARERHVYYLIHKPRGMVTTMKDPEDRPSLSELLHKIPERIYPVGRLDFHTSGALFLTNDGDLAQALLHPSRAVPKTYVVKVNVEVTETMLNALERGVVLDDGYRTQPARVEHLRDEEGKSWIEITITEGKNRQIHRMVESLGARVMRLSRLSFAGLSTQDLRPGDIRELSEDEVDAMRREYLSDTKAAARQPRRANTMDRMRERLGTLGNPAEQGRGQRPRPAREGAAASSRGHDRAAPRDGRSPDRTDTSDRPARRMDRQSDRQDERPVERAPRAITRPDARVRPDAPAAPDPRFIVKHASRGGRYAEKNAPREGVRERSDPRTERAARGTRAGSAATEDTRPTFDKRTPAPRDQGASRNARPPTKKPSRRS